ncbi:MAG: 50S ribosomal protein L22 [Patescibacteria group bacterium]
MDVHASLRHLRMAPRKVRLVVDLVRGLPVADADTRLMFVCKAAARPVLKLLRSAIANAEHNFTLDRSTLWVKTIAADSGVTLKRSRPRARGSAAPIRKRTTHVTIVLSDEPRKSKVKSRKSKVVKSVKSTKNDLKDFQTL